MRASTTAAFASLAALLALSAPAPAAAELAELRVARQYGLTYLQFMVMENQRLVEKYAKGAGLPGVKVEWTTLTSGAPVNDALLSGNIHLAAGGVGAFVTLWEKTRGTLDVKSPAALNAMPMLLVTRNPKVKTIKDFTDADRIALPGVKLSPQAVTLQYAAAKAWGFDNYEKLDHLTVNLSHPESLRALLSGKTEITAYFATPPFSYQAAREPGISVVLNSFDVWDGPQTLIISWTTSKFQKENPKLYGAIVAAIDEATQWINANKRAAAELYKEMAKDRDTVENLLAMLNDPLFEFSTTPKNLMKFVEFKHRIGTMKVKLESWKDMFFANAHSLPGS